MLWNIEAGTFTLWAILLAPIYFILYFVALGIEPMALHMRANTIRELYPQLYFIIFDVVYDYFNDVFYFNSPVNV